MGEEGVEYLLSATTETSFNCKIIKPRSLDKLNVDTTVQEKVITYPTDAKLYKQMRKQLVNQCNYNSVILRQYYPCEFKKLLRKSGKYYHARKPKLAQKQIRKMHTRLGHIMRDIERKIVDHADLEDSFSEDLALAKRLLEQKRTDTNKIYSVYALEVECISKGRAHKTYEFGNKVGLVTTSKEGFIVGAKSYHENPYDGHTLKHSVAQVKKDRGMV